MTAPMTREELATRLREAAYFCTEFAELQKHCAQIADDIGVLPDYAQKSVSEPVAFIDRRLEDLAEANALYGKDQRLGAPDKVARNDREISWLKDLISIILTTPPSNQGASK